MCDVDLVFCLCFISNMHISFFLCFKRSLHLKHFSPLLLIQSITETGTRLTNSFPNWLPYFVITNCVFKLLVESPFTPASLLYSSASLTVWTPCCVWNAIIWPRDTHSWFVENTTHEKLALSVVILLFKFYHWRHANKYIAIFIQYNFSFFEIVISVTLL